jgi:transposase
MSYLSGFDLLQIPGLTITAVESSPLSYFIHAEPDYEPESCPTCGLAKYLRSAYRRRRTYRDTTLHDKKCRIEVRSRLWRCANKGCHWQFMTLVPGMHPKHSMTVRLANRIRRESLYRPFRQVAAEVSCDEALVRELFNEHIARLDKFIRFETSEVMGIDEVHIKGRYICIITNLQHRTVVEVLELKDRAMLFNYLCGLKDRARVRLISADMDKLYRAAARHILPQATVVLDRFHIVARATQAVSKLLDSVRHTPMPGVNLDLLLEDKWALMKRAERRTMEESVNAKTWLENFPVIEQSCGALQSFYQIWDNGATEAEARDRYKAWRAMVRDLSSDDAREAFTLVIEMFTERGDDIFSYFATRDSKGAGLTNAFTEQSNRRIRDIDRSGRGYRFKALRAKILYGNIFKLKPRYERPSSAQSDPISPDAWEDVYAAWRAERGRLFPERELPRPRLVAARSRRIGRKDVNQISLLEGVTDEQLMFLGEQYENHGVPTSEVFGDGGFDKEVA